MTAGLTFFTDPSKTITATADLSDAKVIVYEDGGSNKYTLDASSIGSLDKIDDLKLSNLLKGEVKFKYQSKDSIQAEEITGLGNIIGKLFATKSATDGKTVLAEEVTKEPVVKAIFAAKNSAGTKTVFAEEVEDKAIAEAILGAIDTDGKKSILVEKLGVFLDKDNADSYKAKYDNANEQTVKDFLVSKGLGSAGTADSSAVASKLLDGTNKTTLATAILDVKDGDNPKLETALAGNATLQNAVAINPSLQNAVVTDATFKGTVTSNLADPQAIATVTALQNAVATQLLAGDNKTKLVNEIVSKEALKNAVVTDATFKGTVTSNLADPQAIATVTALQEAVAGKDVLHNGIATKLLTGDNTGKLGKAILSAKDDKEKTLGEQLVQIDSFKNGTKIDANAEDPGFQDAVRKVVSHPVFDIPADENTPLSWDWI